MPSSCRPSVIPVLDVSLPGIASTVPCIIVNTFLSLIWAPKHNSISSSHTREVCCSDTTEVCVHKTSTAIPSRLGIQVRWCGGAVVGFREVRGRRDQRLIGCRVIQPHLAPLWSSKCACPRHFFLFRFLSSMFVHRSSPYGTSYRCFVVSLKYCDIPRNSLLTHNSCSFWRGPEFRGHPLTRNPLTLSPRCFNGLAFNRGLWSCSQVTPVH